MSSIRRITPTEWDTYKKHISTLYIAQNKTLDDVIKCLEDQHGFCATKAQYVRQLKKWGLEKNMKNDTWKFVANQIRKRKLEEKDSEIFIKGKLIPHKKVKKEISRHAASASTEQQSGTEALECVIVRTPDAERSEELRIDMDIPWFRFQTSIESFKHPQVQVDQNRYISLTSSSQHTPDESWTSSHPQPTSTASLIEMFFGFIVDPYHSDPEEPIRHPEYPPGYENIELTQEAGLLLEICMVEGIGTSIPEHESGWYPSLGDITIERHEGDFARHVEELQGPRAVDATFQLLRYWVYLITNNLLHGQQVDRVMTWLAQNQKLWAIESLVKLKSPTAQVLASNLLGSAIKTLDAKFVSFLLANGADVNTISKDIYQARTTALQEAVKLRDSGLVRLLLDAGADPNAYKPSEFGMTALRIAVREHSDIEIAKILIDAGAAVNDIDRMNMYGTLLENAAGKQNIELVRTLLDAKAEVNHFSAKFATALQEATLSGNTTIVESLLAARADVDAPIGKRYKKTLREAFKKYLDSYVRPHPKTAIQIAAAEDNIEMVQILLEEGADADGCLAMRNNRQVDENDESSSASENDSDSEDGEDEVEDLSKIFKRCHDESFFRTPLQSAVENNNSIMVRLLLSAGANVNADTSGPTALQIAANKGDSKLIKLLLNKGANVDAVPSVRTPRRTALQAAAGCGNEDIVQVLLNAGANVNAHPSPNGGRTALQAACGVGNMEVVQMLITAGANINARAAAFEGRTCLQVAIEEGHDDIVHLLLKYGANINAPASERGGRTALQVAIEKERPEIVKLLLEAGVDANEQSSGEGGTSSLSEAVNRKDRDLIRVLLSRGFDPNYVTWRGSIIGLAIDNQDIETVRTLLQAGSHVNLLDHCGQTPLQYAAHWGNFEMVQLLLDSGADINSNNGFANEYQTPLQTAVGARQVGMVELLLSKGANPNTKIAGYRGPTVLSSIGWNCRTTEPENIARLLLGHGLDIKLASSVPSEQPLQKAAAACQIDLVTILLEAGANINAPAVVEHQRTALQAAVAGGSKLLVAKLLEAGADVNAPAAPNGEAALPLAVRRTDVSLVRMLLDAGADVNVLPHPDGETTLQIAVRSGNIALVKMLLDVGADVNAFHNTKSGKSALQEAATRGTGRLIRLLISRDADVNAPAARDHGATALQAAAMKGYLRVAVMLLKSGADINAPAAAVRGRTALDGAAEQGRLDMVFLLLRNDKETDSVEIRCKRAAKLAAASGHLILAKILRDWKVSG